MIFCLVTSLLNSLEDNFVSIIEGAIQLTRTLGANSEARDIVSPSIADLHILIEE